MNGLKGHLDHDPGDDAGDGSRAEQYIFALPALLVDLGQDVPYHRGQPPDYLRFYNSKRLHVPRCPSLSLTIRETALDRLRLPSAAGNSFHRHTGTATSLADKQFPCVVVNI